MTALFYSVLSASLWGSGLTLLCLLINKIFKRALPATWHYYVWGLVLLRFMIPFFITVQLENPATQTQQNMAAIGKQDRINEGLKNTIDLEDISDLDSIKNLGDMNDSKSMKGLDRIRDGLGSKLSELSELSESSSSSQTSVVNTLFKKVQILQWQLVLVGQILLSYLNSTNLMWVLWLTVALVILSYKLISYFFYGQQLVKSNHSPSTHEQEAFEQQKAIIKLKKAVGLYINDEIQTPLAMGFFQPKILLPNKNYSLTQLSHIFQHELTHIKRNDLLFKWLFEVAKAFHWFNPCVYFASRAASFTCETSCDAQVLRLKSLQERKEYGMTILEVVQYAIKPKTPLCVLMSSNKSNLKERINRILATQYKKGLLLAVLFAIPLLYLWAYSSIRYEGKVLTASDTQSLGASGMEASVLEELFPGESAAKDSDENRAVLPAKTKLNLLLAGVEEVGNTDVLMVLNVDTENGKLNLLSIPRDSLLIPSEGTINALGQQGIKLPSEMKINQLLNLSKGSMETLQQEVSKMLNIPLDYYIQLDMSAFQKLVDALGGLEMNIPQGGLYYQDPMQNLSIAIPEGLQHLDGERALHLVRYRAGYTRGDLDRIQVQQEFIQELYKKTLNGQNLIEKAKALASILAENTHTNMSYRDLSPYIPLIPKFNQNSLSIYVLPGEPQMREHTSYVVVDKDKYEQEIEPIFWNEVH